MLKAVTIDPNTRKSKVTCFCCGLSYTARDYLLLYQGKKLAYFRYKPQSYKRQRVFCHNCFYKSTVDEMTGLDQVDVEMTTLDGVAIVTFYRK
jgi:hypothetical protein